jgi:putative Mg2+ transporter-C (MgtC) family protein
VVLRFAAGVAVIKSSHQRGFYLAGFSVRTFWRCFSGARTITMNWQNIVALLHQEMATGVVANSLARLAVAAILGGIIGLERELRHRPAGLRTNMFICFGAAMFTILSDVLAVEHLGDHTRIAAQIIPGIGFIGAGSILHTRGLTSGLTTASTLFVVAGVGMATGGGLYLTAVFATGVILIALFSLGYLEQNLNLKTLLMTYEVKGTSVDEISQEVNRILESEHRMMQNVVSGSTGQHIRLQFDVVGCHSEQNELLRRLKASTVLVGVISLGPVELE